MKVLVSGCYNIPLVTDDKENHNEQIKKALEQAAYTIERISAESIKLTVLQNLKVEIQRN